MHFIQSHIIIINNP